MKLKLKPVQCGKMGHLAEQGYDNIPTNVLICTANEYLTIDPHKPLAINTVDNVEKKDNRKIRQVSFSILEIQK